ncbi:hypothetical protein AO386_03675 [Pseudomonas syringae ICMP 11292]|nr:hypothetical protein AO386_03675 [Pseudomonas syringae ICMP 11292]
MPDGAQLQFVPHAIKRLNRVLPRAGLFQFAEHADFALQRFHRRPIQRAHAIFNGLQFATQNRQRRAQFMGHVGHELAAHLLAHPHVCRDLHDRALIDQP